MFVKTSAKQYSVPITNESCCLRQKRRFGSSADQLLVICSENDDYGLFCKFTPTVSQSPSSNGILPWEQKKKQKTNDLMVLKWNGYEIITFSIDNF